MVVALIFTVFFILLCMVVGSRLSKREDLKENEYRLHARENDTWTEYDQAVRNSKAQEIRETRNEKRKA